MSFTPEQQVPATSSGQSPITPPRRGMSIIQETNDMADLNDRLTAYIGYIQHLEHENQSSSKMLTQLKEDADERMTRVKNVYDNQVLGLQNLVDETAKDKDKLSNHFQALKRDFDDTKSKFEHKGEEYKDAQRTLVLVQNNCTELQQQLTRTGSECDQLLAENKEFEGDVARLSQELGDLRGSLERESFATAAVNDQLLYKKEELQFINQLYEKDVAQLRSHRREEIKEVEGRLQQEFKLKQQSQQSLQEFRSEYEAKLNANKEEMETLFNQKHFDLGEQLEQRKSLLASKIKEITALQEKLDVSSKTLGTFEEERLGLLRKIKEMKHKGDHNHAVFEKMLDERDGDIDSLMKERTELMFQYQELTVSKVGMDNEISTYKTLLETEEKRMSLSPRLAKREATPAEEGRETKKRGLDEER